MDYCPPLRAVIPVGSEASEFSRNTNGWRLVGEEHQRGRDKLTAENAERRKALI